MEQIDRPIGHEDLFFYESHLVMTTAIAMAGVGKREWNAFRSERRLRWLNKAVAVLHSVLKDKAVVERLPLLVRNLQTRM